jgi:hypothetical protein
LRLTGSPVGDVGAAELGAQAGEQACSERVDLDR